MKSTSSFLMALLISVASPVLAQITPHVAENPTAVTAPTPQAKTNVDMLRVLDAQAELGAKPIETLTPEEARKQPTPADGVKRLLERDGKNPNDMMGVTTSDISIPGPGAALQARVYMPSNTDAQKSATLPIIVYYHGGGWVIGTLDAYDATPRLLAKQVNAVVVSVHYRQAPENKFPAAYDDAFAAYKWVIANAATLNGNPSKIAIVGESAGANLAINTAIMARDNHVALPLREVLIYPVASTSMNTLSYRENAEAKPLNKKMMQWFFTQTTRSEDDQKDPRLDITHKADLHGLPPTTLVMAEIDPLRSEGEDLALKLTMKSVKVHTHTYKGVTHEFFGMGAEVDQAKKAEKDVVDDLNASFAAKQ